MSFPPPEITRPEATHAATGTNKDLPPDPPIERSRSLAAIHNTDDRRQPAVRTTRAGASGATGAGAGGSAKANNDMFPYSTKGRINMGFGLLHMVSGLIEFCVGGALAAGHNGKAAAVLISAAFQTTTSICLLYISHGEWKHGNKSGDVSGLTGTVKMAGGHAALYASSIMIPVGAASVVKERAQAATVIFGALALLGSVYLLGASYKEVKSSAPPRDLEMTGGIVSETEVRSDSAERPAYR